MQRLYMAVSHLARASADLMSAPSTSGRFLPSTLPNAFNRSSISWSTDLAQSRGFASRTLITDASLLASQRTTIQLQRVNVQRPSQFGSIITRSLFGAPSPRQNPQIHTHDKYKPVAKPASSYDWMLGRFVMDKNGTVWHRQSGRTRRSKKSPGVLGRLARLKPLHNTYASLFRTLPGVKERLRFWAEPDPRRVPGFEGAGPLPPRARRVARPDLRPDVGCRALRPH